MQETALSGVVQTAMLTLAILVPLQVLGAIKHRVLDRGRDADVLPRML